MGRRPRDVGIRPHARGLCRQARSRFCAGSRAPPAPAGVSRMLNLREYRNRADRLADHLPWAALVAPGVVLNKDGSFQRTLRFRGPDLERSEEHTSELQSLMRISYAVFCLKKKKKETTKLCTITNKNINLKTINMNKIDKKQLTVKISKHY